VSGAFYKYIFVSLIHGIAKEFLNMVNIKVNAPLREAVNTSTSDKKLSSLSLGGRG